MAPREFTITIDSVQIETIPLFVQLAADTIPAYKEIDSLYALDSARYHQAASRSRYYTHPSFATGGFERELYARKYLGLLLAAIEEGRSSRLFARVFETVSKHWAALDCHVRDCQEVILDEALDPRYYLSAAVGPRAGNLLAGVAARYLNSFLAVYPAFDLPRQAALKFALFAACARGRGVKIADPNLLQEIKALSGNMHGTKNFQDISKKLNSPDIKKLARDFKNAIYQQVRPDTEKVWQDDKYIEGWAHCGAYLSSAEGLSLLRQEFRTPPKERDVEFLCRLYFLKAVTEWFRFDRVSQTKEEVETDCAEFVMFGLVILQLLREYKKVRRYCLANDAGRLLDEMSVVKERLTTSEEKLRKATDDIAAKTYLLELKEKQALDQVRQHKREIEALTKEIELLRAAASLEPEVDAGAAPQTDFASPVLEIVAPDTENDLQKLKDVRAVVIGGTERWQTNLSSLLPHFVYLFGDNAGFDDALIINADIIFADIRFKFPHSCYYRLMDIVRRHKKRLVFLSKTNTALAIRQMADALDGQALPLKNASII